MKIGSSEVARIALAAVELVGRVHRLFPAVVVQASKPFEDEDICLMIYRPWDDEELEKVRHQIYSVEFELYQKYGVEAIVKALPLSYLPEGGEKG